MAFRKFTPAERHQCLLTVRKAWARLAASRSAERMGLIFPTLADATAYRIAEHLESEGCFRRAGRGHTTVWSAVNPLPESDEDLAAILWPGLASPLVEKAPKAEAGAEATEGEAKAESDEASVLIPKAIEILVALVNHVHALHARLDAVQADTQRCRQVLERLE